MRNKRIDNEIEKVQRNIEHCEFQKEFNEKLSKSKKASDDKKKQAKDQVKRYERQITDYQAELDVLKSMKD